MTDEMMTLHSLVEKAPDADLLREMIGFRQALCADSGASLIGQRQLCPEVGPQKAAATT